MSAFKPAWAAMLVMLLVGLACLPREAMADAYSECFDGKLRQRIPACTEVLKNPATLPFERELALLRRSIDLSLAQRFAEALQDLDTVLQFNPRSAEALNGRAWILFTWKRSDAGMADVEQALKLEGSYAPAWDTRAHLFQLQGAFDKAFTDYETAIGFGRELFIRMYQCGLRERRLYTGPVDGIYTTEVKTALRRCAFSASCDPLPANEFEFVCDDIVS